MHINDNQRMRRATLAWLATPFALAGLATAGCRRLETDRPTLSRTGLSRRPAFDYTRLDGSQGNGSTLDGHVVLVNFWATTCAECVQEMPDIVSTHHRFQAQGLHTLAVAVQNDPPASVARFAQSRQLPFDVVIDNTGVIAKAFGNVVATPTTFLFDRLGGLAFHAEGRPNFSDLHAHITRLL